MSNFYVPGAVLSIEEKERERDSWCPHLEELSLQPGQQTTAPAPSPSHVGAFVTLELNCVTRDLMACKV